MNLPPERRGADSAREWLKHALSDLRLARLAMNADILSEQVCFHAQQAAEKALKAVLLSQGLDFPFTHDLEQLLEVLQAAGISAPAEAPNIDSLTPYAVQARYPGFWGEITDSDVAEAVDVAERVLTWASNLIGASEK